MDKRGTRTRAQVNQNAVAKTRRDGARGQSKVERFRERFTRFLAKHNLQGDQDAQNLLRDTEKWLNEANNKGSGDVHLAASFPSLARVIEKIPDPMASEAFQGLMREMEGLRDSNSTLNTAVTTLQEEVNGLRVDNDGLREQVYGLRKEINQLKGTLGVREAMRSLERWIAIDIVGSKSAVRKEGLWTLKELKASSEYGQALKERYGVEVCDTITFLKETGDTTAHRAATKDSLRRAIEESDDTEDDPDMALHLVELLDAFCQKDHRPFGWDPIESEARNLKRLQAAVVDASIDG